jgi:hypothetical protein
MKLYNFIEPSLTAEREKRAPAEEPVLCGKGAEMNAYEFKVSLRITHPIMNPEIITDTIEIPPSRYWKAGQPRMSPKGTPLPGENRENYWAANLHEGKNVKSEDILLEDYLLTVCSRFAHLKEFFKEIVDTGGHVEFFIGWFGQSMFGATFETKLMREVLELNAAIALDVYAGDDFST